MNVKMVARYLGLLVLGEGLFMLPAMGAALLYAEQTAALALGATAGLCALLGLGLFLPLRRESSAIYAKEGFVVAGVGWVLVSLLGALPFFFSGEIPHYIDAFFESSSGFTTTGASILTDVEAMSRGLLFWRSFTHWLGGIGVLAFILAVVRGKGAGFALHLMRAETPGPQKGKMLPRMHNSMRGLLLMYTGLSLLNLLFLLAGGMPLFDALCTVFGTAGTGGFGIKADSMAGYSPYLQTVTTVFMALFGVNFTLYFLLLRRQWRAALQDRELWLYLGIMLASSLAITASLTLSGQGGGLWENLHHSAFTASSVMTTTGFTTLNFDTWPEFSRSLLLVLMICGAMAGSTGGGFKVARLLLVLKGLRGGFHRLLHPNSTVVVRMNGKRVEPDVMARTWLYLATYSFIVVLGCLLLSLDGHDLQTNLSAVLSCFNNIGPGLGMVGPIGSYSVFSAPATLGLGMLMLVGRLEIFPILLLFFPDTWNRKT